MKRARRRLEAIAAAALAALLLASACATKPASPVAAVPPQKTVSPGSAQEAKPSQALVSQADAKPEVSFPHRRPFPQTVLIAALPEPALPVAPKTAAKQAPGPAPQSAPTATTQGPAPPAVAQGPAVPSAPKLPTYAAKPATAATAATVPKAAAAAKPAIPAKPETPAKAAVKVPEPEPKNAASAQAIALDPSAEKMSDIARNFPAVEGTRFEVPFGGTGWTYLGEKTSKEGIAYDSRRFTNDSLVFVLNPIKAGDYILRFQRQDSLRGISYEELVGVSVAAKGTAAAAASSAVAPASSAVAPASSAVVPASPAVAAKGSSAAPSFNAAALATPEAALAAARSELSAGRTQGALDALDRLLALAPGGTDEAYILYARALEANGPQKDIKRAYANYRKLRDEYPESAFWDEADARAAYIERHYFDIR